MSHKFGALTLPAQVPGAGESLTDPALDIIGGYLSAVLNAWGNDAWTSRAPNEPIVRKTLFVDPAEAEFIESDLPALYVWRSQIATDYLAEELTSHKSTIELLWVPSPKVSQIRWAERAAFINRRLRDHHRRVRPASAGIVRGHR